MDRRLEMFYQMLLIRRLQERIDADYLQDRMRTPVHLCIGQEAIAVGVCAALNQDDVISSNHRGHGHYLAKGGDLRRLVAELHGREAGCSCGFGGSMHLFDANVGHFGSSSIVGGGIPIGTGYALAFKLRGQKKVSAVFFGDGASEEGVFYESVNFAVLKKLPVIYVLENNGWAVCSPLSAREAWPNIYLNAPKEELYSARINGNDVDGVFLAAQACARRAREGEGPSLLVCDTYRISGHSGCAKQDPAGYRNPGEIAEAMRNCPIAHYKNLLRQTGILDDGIETQIEDKISAQIEDAFAFALNSPPALGCPLTRYVYCEQ